MKGLTASDRYELVGVADLSADARREVETLYPGVRTFDNHRTMFEVCSPDVICISTWPPSHLEVTRDAVAAAPLGLLVEKPLADNFLDGQTVLEMIRAKRLPLVVPHGLLMANHAHEVLEHVHAGAIGQLKLVEIECTGWDIINAGIHWLNFFVALTHQEPIDWVMACCDASTQTYRDGMQVETMAVTYAQTRSGIRVVMNTGDYVKVSEEGKGVVFRLIGTAGQIEFYAWEPRYKLLNQDHPQGQLIEVDPGSQSAHQRYLEFLAEQIDEHEADYTLPESSLQALELCEAAYLSNQYHCLVKLPLTDFIPPLPNNWQPGQPYSGEGGGRNGRQLPPVEPA
jgi:predicted dehydrogenase